MDVLLERIYKTVIDFSKLRYVDQEAVEHYLINTEYQEGSFSFYRELKEWTKYQTGHFWGAKSQYC
ncbi:MAG: hypothetical protein JW708_07435, partial [Vallitaleaceae bacterium]|nr:hypothetical protein [Vallitaleaceae bacterium]